jgi:hypothetical protein
VSAFLSITDEKLCNQFGVMGHFRTHASHKSWEDSAADAGSAELGKASRQVLIACAIIRPLRTFLPYFEFRHDIIQALEQSGWTEKASAYDAHFAPIADQAIEPILDSVGDVAGRDVLDICRGTAISFARLRRAVDASPGSISHRL